LSSSGNLIAATDPQTQTKTRVISNKETTTTEIKTCRVYYTGSLAPDMRSTTAAIPGKFNICPIIGTRRKNPITTGKKSLGDETTVSNTGTYPKRLMKPKSSTNMPI
jgi:hypothetical protein